MLLYFFYFAFLPIHFFSMKNALSAKSHRIHRSASADNGFDDNETLSSVAVRPKKSFGPIPTLNLPTNARTDFSSEEEDNQMRGVVAPVTIDSPRAFRRDTKVPVEKNGTVRSLCIFSSLLVY